MNLSSAIAWSATELKGGTTQPATERGPAAVVERLYEEHYDSLYRYLVLTGSDAADADELVQEGFLRLIEGLLSGLVVDNPKHWLFRVLLNLRVDRNRKAWRHSQLAERIVLADEARMAEVMPTPETALLRQERLDALERAMNDLTERQREYLHLRAEGLKLREIADIYSVAVQAVADSLGRAIARLGRAGRE
jgi:RNA polymerase sigma factor (sigma-70 family)